MNKRSFWKKDWFVAFLAEYFVLAAGFSALVP